MGHRTAFALVVGALVASLSACGADPGPDEEDPTSIDVALLECGDPTNADPTLQLSDVDLTGATWDVPEGFVETFAYSEDLPVEHIDSFWVAEPEQDPVPLNVLTVVGYSQLGWGDAVDECGRVPVAAVDDRLAGYRLEIGAEALTEVEPTEIAGLPALQQDVGLAEYSYRGYWVFSRSQMLHLYCQWTSDAEKEQVLTACVDLLESVEVPGA